MPLPSSGHVLGIDIGFSPTRRSSAVCRLSWRDHVFDWEIERFRCDEAERRQVIARVAAGKPLMAVALDGPVRGDLQEIGVYRMAEKMLTIGLQPHIGKPGQSSAPIGKRLNKATNEVARIVLDLGLLAQSAHAKSIHARAIVEAFPSSFMGLMLPSAASLNGRRDKKSDRYFEALTRCSGFESLLEYLAPLASFTRETSQISNHDDRAALVCALTALCVAAGKYSAVGDQHGWIILPPKHHIATNFLTLLELNRKKFGPDCLHYE